MCCANLCVCSFCTSICLQALEDAGVMPHIKRFAGSSASAIVLCYYMSVFLPLSVFLYLYLFAGFRRCWCDASH